LLSETLSSVANKSPGIIDLNLDLTDGFVNLHLVLGHVESVTRERVTDLLDSFSLHGSIPEHNDVSTSCLFLVVGILSANHFILSDALTLCGSKDKSLEAIVLICLNDTSDGGDD
jgi:hypothetical protein